MKRKPIVISMLVAVILIFSSLFVFADDNNNKIELIFTHDMHSYLEGYQSEIDGKSIEVGGMARLKTLVDEKRAENPELVLLDAGDFSMGTLYQALFEEEALELRVMGKLGYDAVTFGNHEFDYGSQSLANMIRKGHSLEENAPPFVVCNMDWRPTDGIEDAPYKIYKALSEAGGGDYVMLEKNGLKIAVTGLFGKDALVCAPTCEVNILDQVESLKRVVSEIKEKENADMIICLSHSGTSSNLSKSEDEIYAKEVPEIDVIISGHTHTRLEQPKKVGNTYIMSCGEYGKTVGNVKLEKNSDGRFDLLSYNLISIDESIEENPEILELLKDFSKEIDEKYLAAYGYTADQIIAKNDYTFEEIQELYDIHQEMRLGNLLSDAYRYAANIAMGDDTFADVSVAPSGTIRGTFKAGDITVKQAFEAFSLGIGADGTVGYPLIAVYLTGAELKNAVEVDASISDLMTSARLYMSGINYTYNPKRMILNKSYDIYMTPELRSDTPVELEKDKLYCVVTDFYSGQMLGAVTDMSKGLLKIVPKDKDGNVYENLEDAILYDKDGKELKAWIAIADYLGSFDINNNGTSVVPDYYNEYHNRKVVNEEMNPVELLKQPNIFFFGIILIVVLVLAIIIGVPILIIKKKRAKKKRQS